MRDKLKPDHLLAVGLILAIAAGIAMRLVKLGEMPPGLYQDEAFNGMDALAILDGDLALYFPENNGREPMFLYVMAGTVALFGRTPLGVRAAATVFGLPTLAAAYGLGRTWGNKRVGGLTAAILAGLLWHVQISRVGFRAVALPLFIALALALGGWGLSKRTRWAMVGAGIAYGFSFYTYLAAQITPLALSGLLLYALIWQRDWLKDRWQLFLWAVGGAAVVLLPFAFLLVTQPDLLTERAGQVALWRTEGGSLGILLTNALRGIGMFVWRGDANWRHNLGLRPVFDPLMSIVFLAGIGLALLRWRERPALVLSTIWTGIMLLPTILTDLAPHFLRSVGVLPLAALIPALVLDEGIDWVKGRHATPGEWLATGGAAVLVLLSAGLTAEAYFGRYAASSEPFFAFQTEGAMLAQELKAAQEPVWVTGRLWDSFRSVRFLSPVTGNVRYYTEGDVLEPHLPPFSLYAWPYFGLDEALNIIPDGAQVTVETGPQTRDKEDGETYPLWVEWQVEDTGETGVPIVGYDGAGLELLRAEAEGTADSVRVVLAWRINGEMAAPTPKTFVHVLGADGALVAQEDTPPGGVFYPPDKWPPGSVVVQVVQLAVPVDPGLRVTTGLYRPEDGTRYAPQTELPVLDGAVVLIAPVVSE